MSERSHRGTDAVRISADNRVSSYPSGTSGVGPRRQHRTSSREEAENYAEALRNLAGHDVDTHLRGSADQPLFTAMHAMLRHLENTKQPHGTTAQYRSNLRTWVPKEIALTRCGDLGLAQWSTLLVSAVDSGASFHTLCAINRTLGRLARFGMQTGYFPTEPFGPARLRRDVLRSVQATAIRRDGEPSQIHFAMCPTPDDVDEFAQALEQQYPGYGYRLVQLTWACGGRVNEMLALDKGDIDTDDLSVNIVRQLDPDLPWPAVKDPKNNSKRPADLWQFNADVADSLVADSATTNGCLFPPPAGVTNWASNFSTRAKLAAGSCGWKGVWTFHWLRHSYASYGITPTAEGGFGRSLKSVQRSLGHKKLSTTTDIYVQEVERDAEVLAAQTAKRPKGPRRRGPR